MADQSADEALARQLQLEEEHFARQQQAQQQPTNAKQGFKKILEGQLYQIKEYEDEVLQAQAVSILPDHLLALIGGKGETEEQLAKQLLAFFKNDFFTWVNTISCEQCGSSDTQVSSRDYPTEEERRCRAQTVEIHRCRSCGCQNRFPRYNDPGKLLQTRRGRCGEWANCFTLLCRAVGLEARWVRCWEDHVFTEYYSTHQQRWIHMDPCENEYDKPLLYEGGWGKTWSYVVGFGRLGVADVSLRYSKDREATKRRLSGVVDVGFASACCSELTQFLRRNLSPAEARVWQERDGQERVELHEEGSQPKGLLPGRQTGSEAWRAARGELGNPVSSSSGKQATGAASGSSRMQAATNASETLTSPASVTPQPAYVPSPAGTPVAAPEGLAAGGNSMRNAASAPRPKAEPDSGKGKQHEDANKPSKQQSGIRRAPGIVDGEDPAEELKQQVKLDAEILETPQQTGQQTNRKFAAGKPPSKPRKLPPAAMEDTADNPITAATASQTQGSEVSGGKQLTETQPDQTTFAEAVKAEFARIMTAGRGVTPNQAAVQALAIVRKQFGL